MMGDDEGHKVNWRLAGWDMGGFAGSRDRDVFLGRKSELEKLK
jgi:hypothetical protein